MRAAVVACVGLACAPAAAVPAPAVVPPAAAPRQLGTRHPIGLVTIGPERRWVAACQARVDTNGDGRTSAPRNDQNGGGDDLAPYVFRHGVGEGEAVDAFVDASRDGRWLVVVRGGVLTMLDMVDGLDRPIPDADVKAPNGVWRHWARFDDAQRNLLYVRASDARDVAIYDIERASIQVVRASRRVTSIDPEPGAPWAEVWIEPPRGALVRPSRNFDPGMARSDACHGAHVLRDLPRSHLDGWLSIEAGVLAPSPVIAHLAGGALVRATDRAIRLGRETIVPAACDAWVSELMASPLRLIVTCRRGEDQVPAEMFGPGVHAVLSGTSAWWWESRGGIPWRLDAAMAYCDLRVGCFAIDDGRRIALPGESPSAYGAYVFSRRGAEGFVTDVRTGVTTSLLPFVKLRRPSDRVERYGDLAVDVSRSPPRAIGRLEDAVQGLDEHGRMLTAAGAPNDDQPLGPLTWVEPAR